MNVLAISPHLFLTMLQGQNIKRNIAKKVEEEQQPLVKSVSEPESKVEDK